MSSAFVKQKLKQSKLQFNIYNKRNLVDPDNSLFEVANATSYEIGKISQPLTLTKSVVLNSI